MAAIGADHALTIITLGNATNESRHASRIARSPFRINPRRGNQTERSNSEPRGSFWPGAGTEGEDGAGALNAGGDCWLAAARTRCSRSACPNPVCDTPDEKAERVVGVNMAGIIAQTG